MQASDLCGKVFAMFRTFGMSRIGPASTLVLGLALGGCATTDEGAPAALSGAAISRTALDTKDASVGDREHPRLVQGFGGIYRHAKLEAILNEVVMGLVPASERPDQRYQVTILNSPSVNAFALPGGYLYVTRGLLALANDESEVAAVLAHEMAHVTSRHAAQREERAANAETASRVMSKIMKDERAGAVSLAASKVSLAGFSRHQELQADAIGIATIAGAGYDPMASSRFLVSMNRQFELDQAKSSNGKDQNFLATHPSTPERIERAAQIARQTPRPVAARQRSGRESYLAALNGIIYGDGSREGYARGRRFVHTELGLAFEAPEGFVLENTSRAVFGAGKNGEALRFDGAKVTGNSKPVELITSGWIEGATVTDVRTLTIGGLPAATALARTDEWTFRLGAIRNGQMIYRFVLGTKSFTPEIDREFLDAIKSFRTTTGDVSGGARPLKVRVVRVEAGDTVSSLARKMVVDGGDRKKRFLVLNGLRAGERLTPGSLVKIITDGPVREGA